MQRYLGLLAGIAFAGAMASAPILTLKEHYFLRDGQPFFWFGDTAWTLSDHYTTAEAEEYLDHRARQGFNVINVTMVFADGPSQSSLGGCERQPSVPQLESGHSERSLFQEHRPRSDHRSKQESDLKP